MTIALVIGAGKASAALAAGLGAACADADDAATPARHGGGDLDAFVIPLEPTVARAAGFADLGDAAWRADCEIPLRRARRALQVAHRLLNGRGGHILFVVPTAALTGDGGSVAAAAAAEGVRALGKSAAQAWRDEGVSVNFIAVDAAMMRDDVPLGREVVPLIALMLQCPPLVAGSTLVADGGVAMAP